MATQMIRFGVNLDRKVDAEFGEIAELVEKRPKVDFHRVLVNRLVRLWKEKPEALEQLGLVRRGY